MADPQITYCGKFLPDFDWPDAGGEQCCPGAFDFGRLGCTCWEPVYDQAQAEPRTDDDAGVMPKMCADCAYRPGSLERRDDPSVVASSRLLEAIIETGEPFWCHNGLRLVTHFVHPPTGTTYVPATGLDAAFQPPIIDGRPYKADGSPADYCAGWSARFLKAHGCFLGRKAARDA